MISETTTESSSGSRQAPSSRSLAPSRGDAGIRIERVDAREHREDIINLFARNKRPAFASQFDWYYRSDGQSRPDTWILRDTRGTLRGLCSVTVRRFRVGETCFRAGVSGNLMVDAGSGLYLGALLLVRSIKHLLESGEVDVLLGIPNGMAEPVFRRAGYRTIGRWQSWASISSYTEMMRKRLGMISHVAGPIVHAYAFAQGARVVSADARGTRFSVRELSDDQVRSLDFSEWPASEDEIEVYPDGEYLLHRFLHNPCAEGRVYALCSTGLGGMAAYLAVRRYSGRTYLLECSVNRKQLTKMDAIRYFCQAQQKESVGVWVSTLNSAPLAKGVESHAFWRMPARRGGYPDYPLEALWKPSHPLASTFQRVEAWNLLPGFNDV